MPGFNRQGPNGEGPMSGRGMGYCRGNVPAGAADAPAYGRRMGYGRGVGYGRGRRCFGFGYPGPAYSTAPIGADDDMVRLKQGADEAKQTLEAFEQRIRELEEKTKS